MDCLDGRSWRNEDIADWIETTSSSHDDYEAYRTAFQQTTRTHSQHVSSRTTQTHFQNTRVVLRDKRSEQSMSHSIEEMAQETLRGKRPLVPQHSTFPHKRHRYSESQSLTELLDYISDYERVKLPTYGEALPAVSFQSRRSTFGV